MRGETFFGFFQCWWNPHFFSRGGLPKTLGSVTLVLRSGYSNHGAERQNEHHGLMGEPSFGRTGATLMFMIITRCWSSQSKATRWPHLFLKQRKQKTGVDVHKHQSPHTSVWPRICDQATMFILSVLSFWLSTIWKKKCGISKLFFARKFGMRLYR